MNDDQLVSRTLFFFALLVFAGVISSCTPDKDKISGKGKIVCNDASGKQIIHVAVKGSSIKGQTLRYQEKAETGEIVHKLRVLKSGETCEIYP